MEIIPQILADFHAKKHFIRQAFSIHKNRRAGYPEILGTCPLPSLNLRPDFHAVAESEYHPAGRIDRCVIHKPMEQLLIEVHRQFLRFVKPRKEAAENVILNFLPLPLFFQAVHPALQSSVPTGIPVILFAVVVLVKFPGGVLIDQ